MDGHDTELFIKWGITISWILGYVPVEVQLRLPFVGHWTCSLAGKLLISIAQPVAGNQLPFSDWSFSVSGPISDANQFDFNAFLTCQ